MLNNYRKLVIVFACAPFRLNVAVIMLHAFLQSLLLAVSNAVHVTIII
jgi:hypothetical protein